MLNQAITTRDALKNVVFVGFESAGKSALFRCITGMDTGEESNYRGSTVTVRKGQLFDVPLEVIDTPGIQLKDDSATTMLALEQLSIGDTIVLVVRGTNVNEELPLLLEMLDLKEKNVVLVLSYADKCSPELASQVDYYRKGLGISVIPGNTRQLSEDERALILKAVSVARPMKKVPEIDDPPVSYAVKPQSTLFEHSFLGRIAALVALLLLFAVPVYIAYLFSDWIQPFMESWILDPLNRITSGLSDPVRSFFLGDYGMISLGLYSFIWAFPVVLLIGISVAITEESGLKDRITDSLDGWMIKIGLNGKDLIPVLSGFGCNVVAVFQSRTCSSCTRRACISMISFGSACSYQIGASLSIFSSGGKPWLFAPYIIVLVLVGALHTRIWNRDKLDDQQFLYNRTYLQMPTWKSISWRVRSVIKQFLTQAMPIFVGICLLATILDQIGIITGLVQIVGPLLSVFQLPEQAASGILFSVLRKDGLLLLNQDQGSFVESLSGGELFILVYLASTLTACLVTLWTINKEMGATFALRLAGRQIVMSVGSTLLLAWLII